MITEVGKTVPLIQFPDGTAICFYNKCMTSWDANIKYSSADGVVRYIVVIDDTYRVNEYRCGCFVRTWTHMGIDSKEQILLYVPRSTDNNAVVTDKMIGPPTPQQAGVTALPIFELISPVISKVNGGKYQLTWWSNVSNVNDLVKSGDAYEYNPEAIKRFSRKTIADETETSTCAKILCTAPIEFEDLIHVSGGGADAMPRMVPIIRDIAVTTVIAGEGYVTDFTTGGDGGGGIGMHSHLSNDDAGFAAAVFMPSAVMKPMNWS